ncbi:Alpha/beta hydrolase [Pararobbsia alpina]|uniref:alpha/beta hydrolase n=1 Tax=Pararobbsia alpina TaxID=621374 RepID=UPI0039A5F382
MYLKSTLAVAALALAAPMLATPASAATPNAPDTPPGAHNIVIVHGAFSDGSGWRVVHDILIHKGYNVRVVQETMTTLADDVDAVNSAIIGADGPVVLVGKDYGGAVITAAGTRGKVRALVYVAGFEPDVGESVTQLLDSMPKPTDDIHATRDGHLYFDRAKFDADFAGDLVTNRSDFLAASQALPTAAAFGGNSYASAWRDKPSYAVIATDDLVVSPDLQRWMAERAGSKITPVKASHAIEITQPEAVAQVIENAALNAK